MKYKKLLILLTIATLSLTACGKDSEPAEVPTETAVEETTEESTEEITPEESTPEESTEEISDSEPLDIEDRLLEGYKIMLEEGEITQEEYDKLVGSIDEATEAVADITEKEDQSDEEMFKEWLDNGEITQEEYEQLISGEADKKYDEIIIGGENTEDTHVPAPLPEGATYADPSQDEEITFGDAVVPDHLKGKIL